MIPDSKLVKDAAAYVRGHKPADVHPDVASRMASFTRAQDIGSTDLAVQAHAKSLMDLVGALGDDAEVEQVTRPRQTARNVAKKAAAKKATPAKSTAPSRRRS